MLRVLCPFQFLKEGVGGTLLERTNVTKNLFHFNTSRLSSQPRSSDNIPIVCKHIY